MKELYAPKALSSYLGVPKLPRASVLGLKKDHIRGLLTSAWQHRDTGLQEAIFRHADDITRRFFGNHVFYRGLIEFSNVCQNECSYCGINRAERSPKRYTMPENEVVDVANWAQDNGISNVMLQSGELRTEQRMGYLENVVKKIRESTVARDEYNLGVAVSLSVGELSRDQYQRLFEAGARRYLIRIETSNPELYASLHPFPMSWEERVFCMKVLKDIGYMLGTGVMIGLPGQTIDDLANDLLFFKQIGANMIGMGPYITQQGTPAADKWERLNKGIDKKSHMHAMFELTTIMNALARITLGNANISATTALQAIEPRGREIALCRGANVIMPILTPTKYRTDYQLYEGKPCITDTAAQCQECLGKRLEGVRKEALSNTWGDPPNFYNEVVPLKID